MGCDFIIIRSFDFYFIFLLSFDFTLTDRFFGGSFFGSFFGGSFFGGSFFGGSFFGGSFFGGSFFGSFLTILRSVRLLQHRRFGRRICQKLQHRVRVARSQLRHCQNQQFDRSKLPRSEGNRTDVRLLSIFPAGPTRATTELSVLAEVLIVSRGSSTDTSPMGVMEEGKVCVDVQECESRGVTSRIRKRTHCSMN